MEVQVGYQEKVFHQEIHTALKLLSKSGGRISIPGDLPSLGHRKQSSLSAGDNPAPSWKVDQMTSKMSQTRAKQTRPSIMDNHLPVDSKSGVLYFTDQSIGSGLLTVTPSPFKILHISSISAIAFFKWSLGKLWPPNFW